MWDYLTNNNPVYYSTTSLQYVKEELPITNETSSIQTTHISKSLQSTWVYEKVCNFQLVSILTD